MLNAIMMIGTRILFAMGRDGLLWSRAAAVNERGTPSAATLVTTAVALALIATGTFQRLVAVASFFLAANYVVCCLALFVLRRREPALARPFRAWGYPWSAAACWSARRRSWSAPRSVIRSTQPQQSPWSPPGSRSVYSCSPGSARVAAPKLRRKDFFAVFASSLISRATKRAATSSAR